jgi:hypothetical protein
MSKIRALNPSWSLSLWGTHCQWWRQRTCTPTPHPSGPLTYTQPQIYTYSRYWIAVNSLVRAMEGSLDKGDKCRFCPPLWTIL